MGDKSRVGVETIGPSAIRRSYSKTRLFVLRKLWESEIGNKNDSVIQVQKYFVLGGRR